MSALPPVLMLSFGGPENPAEIMPFLEDVTRGRGIPRKRLEGVAEHYRHMGGRSPINEITRRQAEALRRKFLAAGAPRAVYVGQRHSAPFIEETLRRMAQDGVTSAVGFCTAAYRSEASLERYVAAVENARARLGPAAPRVDFVGPWFDHPLFVAALAARIRELAAPEDAPTVFTAHSIPCAMAKESTYVEELRATAALVAAARGLRDWTLAFTSRSGRPTDAWLEPDVSRVIRAKAAQGVTALTMVPLGFVADHVEVLYDLDVEAKACADDVGVTLHRAATVGDHPLFIDMIADAVEAGAPSDPALGRSSVATVFRDGRRVAKVGADSRVCFCFPDDRNAPCLRPAATPGRPPASVE
ncbi:MAG: ferrochelatase [Elusimicrobia bacterium]|nr:ferrochelatase [Elusimicrobiota bacterium]